MKIQQRPIPYKPILSAIALLVLQVPLPIANALLAGVVGLIPQGGSVLSFISLMAICHHHASRIKVIAPLIK